MVDAYRKNLGLANSYPSVWGWPIISKPCTAVVPHIRNRVCAGILFGCDYTVHGRNGYRKRCCANSPLRLRTYGYPCKMCSASVFVVKFKISTRKRCNARINVVRISNMMGDDGIARSWKSDWEPNSGIVVSIASDDNSPLHRKAHNVLI